MRRPLWLAALALGWSLSASAMEMHDPSAVEIDGGVLLFGTGPLVPAYSSQNLKDWTPRGNLFETMPAWIHQELGEGVKDIWAPDAVRRGEEIWVYYAGSLWGKNTSVIGLAKSTDRGQTFKDQGMVFRSFEKDPYNAIDAEFFEDSDGKAWLLFGSFWSGIKMFRVDAKTGMRLEGEEKIYDLAGRGGAGIEAPALVRHDGYYYLFTSWDQCCQGIKSTYRTMVVRSKKISGPYTDWSGRPALEGHAEELMDRRGPVIGPGGTDVVYIKGEPWLFHHYYDGNKKGQRSLRVRKIKWAEDGWPVIEDPREVGGPTRTRFNAGQPDAPALWMKE